MLGPIFLAWTAVFLPRHVLPLPLDGRNDTFTLLAAQSEFGPLLNPASNFPDPSLILVGSTWYSFATRTIGNSVHIQIATSQDFQSWELVCNDDGSQRDALPNLPPWVNAGGPNTWAPDVVQLDDGSFVMYFAASTAAYPKKHCIGAATSDTILGPYKAQPFPLVCPLSLGGAIDASGYNDGGQRYIVYKIDGNSIGHGGACGNTVAPIVSTPLVLQPVHADAISPSGPPKILLNNLGALDQGTIEAPTLAKFGSTYILFFSSGCFTTDHYTVAYATASNISGPYTRATKPLFQSGDYDLVGPGGMSVWQEGGYMVFHAWVRGGVRTLFGTEIGVVEEVVGKTEGVAWFVLTRATMLTKSVRGLIEAMKWK